MHLDRRNFIAGLGALGAGSLLHPSRAFAQGRRVDIHHHMFPPDYTAAIVGRGEAPSPRWTPGQSIEEMDRSGIAVSVLSLSPPNVVFPDAAFARRLARQVNEYGAKMAKDYPGRFGLFAVLPLPDTEGSLREIEYAMDTLKAHGIGLMTSYGSQWLGDAAFAPVWEELNRRKAVVYTHPLSPGCCGNLKYGVPAADIEWATDTTRTVASLVFSGTAARFPEIRWIFSHGGGTMPFLLSRFLYEEKIMKEKDKRLPRGLLYELQKFYYDTAQANHPGALAALLKIVTPSQMLFGTDYPYRTGGEVIAGLEAQRFAENELEAIERNNAMKLLPELKG
jgi:predicted TIM-barrel fold metal-dependent hydrolase